MNVETYQFPYYNQADYKIFDIELYWSSPKNKNFLDRKLSKLVYRKYLNKQNNDIIDNTSDYQKTNINISIIDIINQFLDKNSDKLQDYNYTDYINLPSN